MISPTFRLFLLPSLLAFLLGCTTPPLAKNFELNRQGPLILAHRGYPGKLPDHTLESYLLAIESGADVIEPDLVMTKDGALICRHENELSLTTNVENLFPNRKTTKLIDGEKVTGWFSEDFTLAEIKTLRARQPLSFRSQHYNDKYEIPTFDEFLSLIEKESQKRKQPLGIYPEIKHSTYFQDLNLPMEGPLLSTLKKRGFDKSTNPVYIQSFEVGNLQKISEHADYVTKYKLIQLIGALDEVPFDQRRLSDDRRQFNTYREFLNFQNLEEKKAYLHGLGLWKKVLHQAPDLIKTIQSAGLKVHVYTFRDEAQYLAPQYLKDPQAEYLDFFRMGVDGVFSDHTSSAVKARKTFFEER